MEREIKFRGLRVDGKGWVYGSLLNHQSIGEVGENLSHYSYSTVIPETIGQFTGLTDKNGKDIYEGDNVMSFKKNYEDNPSINTVEFLLGCFKLVCTGKSDITIFQYSPKHLEIIGNIHEK